ncbi:MAG TPA: 50S ribosomal protein L21 [Pseudorhodoplanes sp.]|jgi:large subunit ribosomal protein L21|nr:50S ribosomal protein L21 [Pseudorhodoplanes sp.]
MFAVIKTGGLQYRVTEDQVLKIGKVKGEPGEIIQLGNVIMLGGDKPQLGSPAVPGASVAAEVLEQARGPKIIAFKKRRRKNSRRKRGFRASYTLIRVTEILTDGKAPSKAAKPRPQPKPKAEKPQGEAKAKPAKSKAGAKKPKTAAKKPAAKGKK